MKRKRNEQWYWERRQGVREKKKNNKKFLSNELGKCLKGEIKTKNSVNVFS